MHTMHKRAKPGAMPKKTQAEEEAERKERQAAVRRRFKTERLPKPKEGHTWLVLFINHEDCSLSRLVGQVKTKALEEVDSYPDESGEGWAMKLLEHAVEGFKEKVDDLVEGGDMDAHDKIVFDWFIEHGGAPHLCKQSIEASHDSQWYSVVSDGPTQVVHTCSGDML